jgi:uncharacterized membrane protein (DUF373 family)
MVERTLHFISEVFWIATWFFFGAYLSSTYGLWDKVSHFNPLIYLVVSTILFLLVKIGISNNRSDP